MTFVFRGKQLPSELEDSLRAYIETGRPTGGFLEAVICDRLHEACSRADDENVWIIPVIASFLFNEAPSQCWGHPDSFKNWIERKHAEREKQGVL